MNKKPFHTITERKGDYEIRYIAGEDFAEMGSIAGEQYLAAIYFCKLYESSFSGELFPDDIKFVEETLREFIKENNLDISKKYPSYKNATAKFSQKIHPEGYTSLFMTVFSDYRNIWIKLEEVSHQNFHPEYHHYLLIDSATLLYGIGKYKKLCEEYLTESFYRDLVEGDIRD